MLTDVLILLNQIATRIADVVLAPIGWLPGWLSITVVSAFTGIATLLAFKYLSNQNGIKRTRDTIKSNLLALSLFRDELRVSLRCQLGILIGALQLFYYSLIPMLVMALPVMLLLGQLSLWFQVRPLRIGEESVVTVQLAAISSSLPEVELLPTAFVSLQAGPVRVLNKRIVCWKFLTVESGQQQLSFRVDGKILTKDLAVGAGFRPTSLKRPGRDLTQLLMHPREAPFAVDSPVQSIDIEYPHRESWTCGSNSWFYYFLTISLITTFVAKPLLNVNI